MSSSQQIKVGALVSYLALGINILTGLIYTPWMINSIGRENYGLFTLSMSVISLFVFDFGLSSAVSRFMAKYLAEGRQDKANNFLGIVVKLYLYIDVLFLVVLTSIYFFIPQIYAELTLEEIEQFKVIYVISAAFSVFSFPFIPLNGILAANEKFVPLKICDLMHKLMIVGTMTICLLLGMGLYALVLVNALSGVLTILMKLWCIKHYTQTEVIFTYKDNEQLKEIVSFSGWTTVVSLCQRMIFTIAPSILGMISGSTAIAIFGIAISIESYIYYFANALNGLFLPRVARMVSNDEDIMPLMNRIGKIQLIIVGAVIVGFISVGNDFIYLWVGDKFKDSFMCSVLVIIPSLFYLPQEIGIQLILVKNEVKYQAIVWIVMAVLSLFLSFILGKHWDALGVSVAICIAYMVRTIGLDFILTNRLKVNIPFFFKSTYTRLLVLFILLISIFLIINLYSEQVNIGGFIIKICCFVVLYIGCVCLALNEEERQYMVQSVKSLYHKQ
jgi:O-antigen/teichoic acid export membrane protein